MGALPLNVQHIGSSHLRRQEVWELSLEKTKSVGALTLSVQNVGAPLETFKSRGALIRNNQKYVSSRVKRSKYGSSRFQHPQVQKYESFRFERYKKRHKW